MSLKFLSLGPTKLTAPLLIYLPGMDGSGRLLHSQFSDLGRVFDVRCLSIPVDDLNDWEVLTGSVIALIKQEVRQSWRPLYLCGESFGACLALKVIIEYPKLIDRLIIINSASSFHRQVWSYPLVNLIDQTPDFFYSTTTKWFLPFLVNVHQCCHSEIKAILKEMELIPFKTVRWRIKLLKKWQICANQLRKFVNPTLIVSSQQDKLLPSVSEGKRLAQFLPDAEIITLPHSGHACLLEKNINLYQIIKERWDKI